MRRAAVRALRTTCQYTARSLLRADRRGALFQAPICHGLRHSSTGRPQPGFALDEPMRSSIYFRRFSVVLASGLVGYGAWYLGKGNGTAASQSLTRGYSSGQTAADATPTRNVLVIGADELHTGTFVGDGPISKMTDEGRKVVEMLTPDQATQKLRKNEQSYFVNRGQGVVRYDLVQLPSNDPIEDDHAEKIVEVPGKAAAGGGDVNSDWMFWGVFDGHS